MNNIEKYQKACAAHRKAEQEVSVHVRSKLNHFAHLAHVVISKKFGEHGAWRRNPKVANAIEEALGIWGNIARHGFELTRMREHHILVTNENLAKVRSRGLRHVAHSSTAIPRVRGGEIEIPVAVLSISDRQFCTMIRKGIREAKTIMLYRETMDVNVKIENLQKELTSKERELDELLKLKQRSNSLYDRSMQREQERRMENFSKTQ